MFLIIGALELGMLVVMISVTVFGSEKLKDWELGLVYMLCSINIFFILLFLEPCINQNDEMKKMAGVYCFHRGRRKKTGRVEISYVLFYDDRIL